MDPRSLAETLSVVDDALWGAVIFSEDLPGIATEIMSAGADSPNLRVLAGLDLGPVDPRDVRDVFNALLDEQSVTPKDLLDRVETVTHLVSVAHLDGTFGTRQLLDHVHWLAAKSGYPDTDLTVVYGLLDEWEGGWGRSQAAIEEEVQSASRRIAERNPPPPQMVLDAMAGRFRR